MNAGERIKTGLGEVLILDIKDNYLILFSDLEGKFIKANGWYKMRDKIIWSSGEYYNSFDDLVDSF